MIKKLEQLIPTIPHEQLFRIEHKLNNYWQCFGLQEYCEEQRYCIAPLAAANMASVQACAICLDFWSSAS
jgi:hypothetical protein